MDQKYINEIKEEADRLIELTDNPYCQGPVSLLNGVKHVIPILLEKLKELCAEMNIDLIMNYGALEKEADHV